MLTTSVFDPFRLSKTSNPASYHEHTQRHLLPVSSYASLYLRRMVGVAGRSKGCDKCRRRHLKCGKYLAMPKEKARC
jgi:hypothetical protein